MRAVRSSRDAFWHESRDNPTADTVNCMIQYKIQIRNRSARNREKSQMTTGAYEELQIAAALCRPADYPTACYELAALLRLSYSQLPKDLQSLVFQDTLVAFRVLPDMRTGYEVAAANSLVQAAEAVLPKQKKAAAVSEFKKSIVAHKRHSKSYYDGDTSELPHDVLVNVFRFLDMRTLVAASSVCWTWNSAASENSLWQRKYSIFFGDSYIKQIGTPNDIVWKDAFREKYTIELSAGGPTNRALCRICGSTVWLSRLTCKETHHCVNFGIKEPRLELISARKVANYVTGDDSEDDEDLDEEALSSLCEFRKLWAYPRFQ